MLTKMASFVSIALVMLLIVSTSAQGSGQPQLHINGAITCQSSAVGCSNFGTPSNPALSCQHVKDVCPEAASDFYYIESAGLYRKVFCEMDIEGGGWSRYGRSNQTAIWNYVEEDATEITLDIIYPFEVKEMIDLKYNHFLVQTDVVFKLQADNSANPSRLTTRSLPWLEDTPLFIPNNNYRLGHIRIEFPSGSVDRVTCIISGYSNGCRQVGGLSLFFFQSLFFSPRGTGASAHSNPDRNMYTWNGSYYYVYAK